MPLEYAPSSRSGETRPETAITLPRAPSESFAAALKATFASVKSMRGKVQALLLFAVRHYVEHGNTQFLTMIQQQTDTVHALPSKGMQAYIQAVANVEFIKNADGDKVYRKTAAPEGQNEPNVARCDETVLAVAWYDWLAANKIGRSQAGWKLEKYLVTVIATLNKAQYPVKDFAAALAKKAA